MVQLAHRGVLRDVALTCFAAGLVLLVMPSALPAQPCNDPCIPPQGACFDVCSEGIWEEQYAYPSGGCHETNCCEKAICFFLEKTVDGCLGPCGNDDTEYCVDVMRCAV